MSTSVTPGINAPPSTYPIPAPGDGVTSANTLQYVQPIVDAIGWLQSKVPGANPVGSPIQLWAPVANAIIADSSGVWIQDYIAGASGQAVVYQFTSGSQNFLIPLRGLTPGISIDEFRVYCIGSYSPAGGTTHGASLPVTMPLLELYKLNWNSALGGTAMVATVVGSQSDSSVSVATYEEIHVISKTLGTPEVVDFHCEYFLRVTGEQGTHYQNGFTVFAGRAAVSSS